MPLEISKIRVKPNTSSLRFALSFDMSVVGLS